MSKDSFPQTPSDGDFASASASDGISSVFGSSHEQDEPPEVLDAEAIEPTAKKKGDPKALILAGVLGVALLGGLGSFAYFRFVHKPAQEQAKRDDAIKIANIRPAEAVPSVPNAPAGPAPIDMFSSGSAPTSTTASVSVTDAVTPAPATQTIAPVTPTVSAPVTPVAVGSAQPERLMTATQAPAKPVATPEVVQEASKAPASKPMVASAPKKERVVAAPAKPRERVAAARPKSNKPTKTAKANPRVQRESREALKQEFIEPQWTSSARVLAIWPQTGSNVQAWVQIGTGSEQRRYAVRSGDELMGLRVESISPEKGEIRMPGGVVLMMK